MTDREWDRVIQLLAENWPHQLQPNSALAKYRRDLDRFPVDQVLVAVETFYRDGREFPPNGGHILGRLADLTFDVPPWHDALRAIRRALHKPSDLIVEDDSDKGWHYEDVRLTWLEREAPFIAQFVKGLGLRHIRLEEGNDEARLRDKYRDFTRRARESVLYGDLPPAGLRRLERVRDGEIVELDRRGAELPHRTIAVSGHGLRKIEQEEKGRKIGFSTVAARGREAA